MNIPATASQSLGGHRKKNAPYFPDLRASDFLSKRKGRFFFGALPSRSRAGGGDNADSVLRSYFAGGRIRKTETNVFEIRRDSGFRPAGGSREECGAGTFAG